MLNAQTYMYKSDIYQFIACLTTTEKYFLYIYKNKDTKAVQKIELSFDIDLDEDRLMDFFYGNIVQRANNVFFVSKFKDKQSIV